MARKADVKGGNGDVVFDAETGTARKYLRNTSTAEKVTRFKRELAVFQELCKNPIPNVVEVTDVYIDEDKIAESYVEMIISFCLWKRSYQGKRQKGRWHVSVFASSFFS